MTNKALPSVDSDESNLTADHQSVRALSKAANRQKILDSARILFGQKGYDAATLRDIAQAAGLSTGAVFANFADKRDIFNIVLKTERERVLNILINAYDETQPLEKRLSDQFSIGYAAAKDNVGMFISAIVLQWNATKEMPEIEEPYFGTHVRHRVVQCLSRAIELKEISENAPINLAAGMLEDLCTANLRRAYFKEIDETTLMRRVTTQCEFICKTLRAY